MEKETCCARLQTAYVPSLFYHISTLNVTCFKKAYHDFIPTVWYQLGTLGTRYIRYLIAYHIAGKFGGQKIWRIVFVLKVEKIKIWRNLNLANLY